MPESSPQRSQDYDRWRGEMEARVRALEEIIRDRARDSRSVGHDLVSIRVDMTDLRADVRGLRDDMGEMRTLVASHDEAVDTERKEMISDLKLEIRQGRMTRVQVGLALSAPIIAGVIVFLIISAITGQFSAPHH